MTCVNENPDDILQNSSSGGLEAAWPSTRTRDSIGPNPFLSRMNLFLLGMVVGTVLLLVMEALTWAALSYR